MESDTGYIEVFGKQVELTVTGPFKDLEEYWQWELHHPCSVCKAPASVNCIPRGEEELKWMEKWEVKIVSHEDRYKGRSHDNS